MTIHNQIDYDLCQECHDGNEYEMAMIDYKLKQEQEEADKERKRKNALARERYRRPENVEKRRLAKEEREKERAESYLQGLRVVAKVLSNWRGLTMEHPILFTGEMVRAIDGNETANIANKEE
jgi:hypothetical protein